MNRKRKEPKWAKLAVVGPGCPHKVTEVVGSIVVGNQKGAKSYNVVTCKDCKISCFEVQKVNVSNNGPKSTSGDTGSAA